MEAEKHVAMESIQKQNGRQKEAFCSIQIADQWRQARPANTVSTTDLLTIRAQGETEEECFRGCVD